MYNIARKGPKFYVWHLSNQVINNDNKSIKNVGLEGVEMMVKGKSASIGQFFFF